MNQHTATGDIVDINQQGSIEDQAAHWLARLDDEPPSPETKAAFKHWVRQSPQHKAAFEDYVAYWERMNLLSQMNPPPRPAATRWYWPLSARPAMALCGLLLTVAFSLQLLWPAERHYRTAIGEQKIVELSDGSTVTLNTDSQLTVRYSEQRRQLWLQQGEAHFDVASNPERPFEVNAGQGLVRAVGTAFSVRLQTDNVEVLVNEGVIEVLPQTLAPNPAKPQAVTPPSTAKNPQIAAGNSVTYDRHTATHLLLAELQAVDDQLAWREGLLVFNDEPLAQVVREVERYITTKIHIPEVAVGQLKIGGQFKVGELDAIFEALRISFNVRADYIADDLVYLVRNETAIKK